MTDLFEPPTEDEIIADLDPGIRAAVVLLREHGVDTAESCQGGTGHAYPHAVIHFGGDDHAGLHAVWLLENAGYHVSELVRIWDLNAGTFAGWRVDLEPLRQDGDAPVIDMGYMSLPTEVQADLEGTPGGSMNPTPDCGYQPRKPPAATELWWCAKCTEFHGPAEGGG